MDSIKLVKHGAKDLSQDRETGLATEVNNLIQLLRNPTLKGFIYAVEVDAPENPVKRGRIATGLIGTTNCIADMLDALGQSVLQMVNEDEDSARRDSNEQRNDDESDDQESEKDWDDPTQF